jgi:Zn-dependent membrane protease YugP
MASAGITAQQLLWFYKQKYNMTKLKFSLTLGELSDYYSPRKRLIALSKSTYNNTSVAALAVVSHEFGHAMQHKNHSFLYLMHRFVGFWSKVFGVLVIPATIAGLIMLLPFLYIEYIGVWVLVGAGSAVLLGLLGRLLTISIEYDASNRAKKILSENKILTDYELKYVDKVLGAAGFTYVASFISTILGITFIKRLVIRRSKTKQS